MVKATRYFMVLLFIFSLSCINSSNYQVYKNFKEKCNNYYNNQDIFLHFPENLNNKVISYFFTEPDTIALYADAYVVKSFTNNEENTFEEKDYIYKVSYNSEEAFKLRLDGIQFYYLYDSLDYYYNQIQLNQLPIPNFYNISWELGDEFDRISFARDNASIKISSNKYIIPEDLVVYVVRAESGNFWKLPNNEQRPEILGKWKNGYSSGYAISKKYEKICFWIMIW